MEPIARSRYQPAGLHRVASFGVVRVHRFTCVHRSRCIGGANESIFRTLNRVSALSIHRGRVASDDPSAQFPIGNSFQFTHRSADIYQITLDSSLKEGYGRAA